MSADISNLGDTYGISYVAVYVLVLKLMVLASAYLVGPDQGAESIEGKKVAPSISSISCCD